MLFRSPRREKETRAWFGMRYIIKQKAAGGVTAVGRSPRARRSEPLRGADALNMTSCLATYHNLFSEIFRKHTNALRSLREPHCSEKNGDAPCRTVIEAPLNSLGR